MQKIRHIQYKLLNLQKIQKVCDWFFCGSQRNTTYRKEQVVQLISSTFPFLDGMDGKKIYPANMFFFHFATE